MDDLRRLLAELRGAEEERQRLDRTSPEYEHATVQVDRISRAVWEAVQDDRAKSRTSGHAADVDGGAAGEGPNPREVAAALDELDGSGPAPAVGSNASEAVPPAGT